MRSIQCLPHGSEDCRRLARPPSFPAVRSIPAVVLWLLVAASTSASDLGTVSVQPLFFNPTLGQNAEILIGNTSYQGLTIEILDRDRFLVRSLVPEPRSELEPPGELRALWDGKDEAGDVLPDEAYTLRVVQIDPDGTRSVLYDPSADFAPEPLEVNDILYSRQKGVLSYTLPVPARVHIQAGQARPHPETGEPAGPILKTIVDREPRAGGAIIESWSGRDESGTFSVPDLPGFVVSVVATSLPESSLITVGNRNERLPEYAQRKRPSGVPEPRRLTGYTSDHADLNAFEDRSPALEITPRASFEEERGLKVIEGKLSLRIEIEPAIAPYFLHQPTELLVFVNTEEVLKMKNPDSPAEVTVTRRHLPPGDHRVIVNWASEFGPLGVQTIRVHVPPAGEEIAEGHK